MVIFGAGATGANDTWALSLAEPTAWEQLLPAGILPAPRVSHTAVYDALHRRMLVHAGNTVLGEVSDTWALTFYPSPVWTEIVPSASPPPARYDHTATYDPVGHRMVIYAGSRGYIYDTWALELGGVPTPVLLSLVSAGVRDGRVELEWFSADAAASSVTVYRRTSEGSRPSAESVCQIC